MAPTRPTVRVKDPADYAQLAPYVLGFTPTESLVIFAVQSGRVQVTARADFADVVRPRGVETLLARMWQRFPNARAAMVAYTADHPRGWRILRRGEHWLPSDRPHQTLLVDGDTWHLRDGTTGTIDHNGRIAAQAVAAGLGPLRTRAEIEAKFISPPDSKILDRQLERALSALPEPDDKAAVIALTKTLLDRYLRSAQADQPDTRIPVHEAIQLAVLVQDPDARAIALVSIDQDNAHQHLQLWQDVITQSPELGADMALYLSGMAAWVADEGASASIALDRALAHESRHGASPARLLHNLIGNVVPPTAWEFLRRSHYANADPLVRQVFADRAVRRPGWELTPDLSAAPSTPEQTRRRSPAPGLPI